MLHQTNGPWQRIAPGRTVTAPPVWGSAVHGVVDLSLRRKDLQLAEAERLERLLGGLAIADHQRDRA
jgi:hypothetical protein